MSLFTKTQKQIKSKNKSYKNMLLFKDFGNIVMTQDRAEALKEQNIL